MKKFIFLLSILTVLTACDKVEDPYVEAPMEPIEPIDSGEVPSFLGTLITDTVVDPANATVSAEQNILLEDFTGFKCTNCPEAHEVSDNLRNIYGDQINIISIHATEAFAEPDNGAVFPDPFSQDFRTVDGEIYVSQFGIFALPSGIINREKFEGFFPVAYGAWESTVDDLSTLNSPVNLDIQNVSFANDTLDINCSFEFLEDLTGDYFVSINLVENEIISAQVNGGATILDYVQKDVFRGSLNGSFGEPLTTDPQNLDLKILEGHYLLPGTLLDPDVPNPDIEIGDCHVIIYIYKQDLANDIFDLIQVEHMDVSI